MIAALRRQTGLLILGAGLAAAGWLAAMPASGQSLNTRTHTPPGAAAKQNKLIGGARIAGAKEGRTLVPQTNRVPCGASIGGAAPPTSGAQSRVQSQTRPAPDTVITGDVVVDCGTGARR